LCSLKKKIFFSSRWKTLKIQGSVAKIHQKCAINKEEIMRMIICYLMPLSGNTTKEKLFH